MVNKGITRRIVALQISGFSLVVFFVGIDEALDLPHHLFGALPSVFSWEEYLSEAFLLLLLGTFIVVLTSRLLKRLKYLEGIIPACAFCKNIRVGNSWVPLEDYLSHNSDAQLSHGFCPACAEKHYGIKIPQQTNG